MLSTGGTFYLIHPLLLQGSLTGGFLARPASKYSAFNIPFFCNFPYVLPCLVGVAANIVSFISKYITIIIIPLCIA